MVEIIILKYNIKANPYQRGNTMTATFIIAALLLIFTDVGRAILGFLVGTAFTILYLAVIVGGVMWLLGL